MFDTIAFQNRVVSIKKKKVTRYKAKQFKQEVLVFVDSTSSDIQDEVWCSRLQF